MLGVMKQLAQGLKAIDWRNQDSNPGLSSQELLCDEVSACRRLLLPWQVQLLTTITQHPHHRRCCVCPPQHRFHTMYLTSVKIPERQHSCKRNQKSEGHHGCTEGRHCGTSMENTVHIKFFFSLKYSLNYSQSVPNKLIFGTCINWRYASCSEPTTTMTTGFFIFF